VHDEGPQGRDDDREDGRPRRWRAAHVLALLALAPLLLALIVGGVLWVRTDVPAPESVANPQVSELRYSDGAVLARTGVEDRTSVPLDQVSPAARRAVLAAEDRNFYDQAGISPRGIVRALWTNLRSGEIEQGGSTITQQYARNAFLSQERTLGRKVRETIIALKLDRSRSKDELLERYLNTVYFGRGAYGIQAAARTYLGKPAADLTAQEGAVLASLLRSPSAYDPARHPGRARDRWRYVLQGMVEEGWLEEDAADAEYPEVLPPQSDDDEFGGPEGYLVTQVLEELEELGFPEDVVDVRGLRIDTTLDRQMQASAGQAVEQVTGAQPPDGVYRALVSVQPGTGRVLASYAGHDFVSRPFDAVTQGRAQAGSSFKPYVLAAALREGISLRSRFDGSSPQTFGDYEVKNFGPGDGQQFGRINLVTATASSVNTVYVPLGLAAGTQQVADTAADLGIDADMSEESALPSISLGVTAVTPLEQATAYATLAAGGVRAEPFLVERVVDRSGEVVYEAAPQPERVLDGALAADVTHALQQVVAQGSGRAAALAGRPAAGKTGTTSGNTAAWFVGYTPEVATAVALFTDRSDRALPSFAGVSEVTGGSLPARIWGQYMNAALEGAPAQPFPEPVFVGEPLGLPSPSPSPPPARRPGRFSPAAEPTRPPPPPSPRPELSSMEPTREPSPEPEPTQEPSPEPEPTQEPSPEPEPTQEPSPEPTEEPTREPSPEPEPEPTEEPTREPSPEPEPEPTKEPSPEPEPTQEPSLEPQPTGAASPDPEPTGSPSSSPG
jgi:membrane peptidoglycan carboxypeptidase